MVMNVNKIFKGILDLGKGCNTVMAVNISKILVEPLKGNIFDLVECCLSLSDVFYFGSIYIHGPRTNFFNCVLGGRGEWKENNERTKKSGGSLCIKHRDSLSKNKFAVLRNFAKGQNLSFFVSFNKKNQHVLTKS